MSDEAERDHTAAKRDEFRQAALELHAEIRNALFWLRCREHNVADAILLKVADKWRGLLGEDDLPLASPRTK